MSVLRSVRATDQRGQGCKGVPCGDVVKVTIEITNNSNRTVVVDGAKGSNIK